MKKIAVRLTFIFVLFFSLVTSSLLINLVNANPAPLFPFPWNNPVTTTPQIIITSPIQNQTYSTHVWLNFTLVKPETWFPDEYWSNFGNNEATFGNVTSVYYIIDNSEQQNMIVHDVDTAFASIAAKFLD